MSALDRFKAEAPKAWAQAAELDKNVDIEITERTRTLARGFNWTQRRQLDVKATGNNIIQQISTFPIEGIPPPEFARHSEHSRVDAINSQHAFSLYRAGKMSPWVLVAFGPPDGQTIVDDHGIRADIDRLGRHWIISPWCVIDWPVQSMLDDPGVQFEGAADINDAGDRLVAVSFSVAHPNAAHDFIRGGRIVFDPNGFWEIRSAVLQKMLAGIPAQWSITNEYSNVKQAIPSQMRYQLTVGTGRDPTDQMQVVQTLDFSKYNRTTVPEDAFSPDSFGVEMIEAPKAAPAKVNPWIVVMSVTLGLFLALGAFCFWLWRRVARGTERPAA